MDDRGRVCTVGWGATSGSVSGVCQASSASHTLAMPMGDAESAMVGGIVCGMSYIRRNEWMSMEKRRNIEARLEETTVNQASAIASTMQAGTRCASECPVRSPFPVLRKPPSTGPCTPARTLLWGSREASDSPTFASQSQKKCWTLRSRHCQHED